MIAHTRSGVGVDDNCLLFTVGHRKKDYSRSMGLGLGAVHPKLSGSTIDTGKPLY